MISINDQPHRPWLRFNLRTLFTALTLSGIFLGWLSVQVKWIRDRHAAIEWITSINRRALILPSPPGTTFEQRGETGIESDPWTNAPWGLRLLGEAGVSVFSISSERAIESDRLDERLPALRKLFPEAQVEFSPMPAVSDPAVESPIVWL